MIESSYKLRNSDNKGFTLVELIVVLVILAILAAILIPALLGYIDEASTKQDILDAKNIMTAAQTYLDKLYGSDSTPNYEFHENLVSGNDGQYTWSKKYTKGVCNIAGILYGDNNNYKDKDSYCPYIIGIYVGSYPVYENNNIHKAYTVYGIIYQRSKTSNTICFNGEEWITDMKGLEWPFNQKKGNEWSGTKPAVTIDGKNIAVVGYYLHMYSNNPASYINKIKQNGRVTE